MLEVICESVEDARAAEAGGADRIELVRDLDQDGLTPSLHLAEAVKHAVKIPVRAMLRERNTFDSNPAELRQLCTVARAFQALSVDGLVLGFTRAGFIDTAAVRAITSAAPDLSVTFHRAIEHVNDPAAALNMLATFPQVDTLLHSGGHGDVQMRIRRLNALLSIVNGRMTVLAGGGMTSAVIQEIRAATRIRAFHVGRSARAPATAEGVVDAARVADLVRLTKTR